MNRTEAVEEGHQNNKNNRSNKPKKSIEDVDVGKYLTTNEKR